MYTRPWEVEASNHTSVNEHGSDLVIALDLNDMKDAFV